MKNKIVDGIILSSACIVGIVYTATMTMKILFDLHLIHG
jgi:hypothetical protein